MKSFVALFALAAVASALPQQSKLVHPLNRNFGRIVGGDEAEPHSVPNIVALSITSGFQTFFCGGSIIADNIVISAAHCLDSADSVEVKAGAHNQREDEPEQQVRVSTDFTVHEDWKPFAIDNDISMIFLDEPFELNDNVNTVDRADAEPAVGDDVTVSGWGLTCDVGCGVNDVLMTVTCPVVDDQEAADYYGDGRDYAHFICISAEGGHGSCNGDSGGPLVTSSTGEQTGLTSFGASAGCESGHPDCFTSVPFFNDWIDTNMAARK